MVRICTVLLTVALAAPTWGQLPPNVAKNAKAASAAANTRPAKRYYGRSKPPAAKQVPAPEPQVASPAMFDVLQTADETMPPRHQRASFAERVRNWLGGDA